MATGWPVRRCASTPSPMDATPRPTAASSHHTSPAHGRQQPGGRHSNRLGLWTLLRDGPRHRWANHAFDVVTGDGNPVTDCHRGIRASYGAGVTDEFIEPVRSDRGEWVISGSNPATRASSSTSARPRPAHPGVDDPDFDGFDRGDTIGPDVDDDDDALRRRPAGRRRLPTDPRADCTGDQRGRLTVHSAETEKYPHVTFFLHGGREEPFPGEDRKLIPSPKVPTTTSSQR